jgi:hypothetical protein
MATTPPPAAGSEVAPATRSCLTILPFRGEPRAVQAACDDAVRSWTDRRDPFAPPGVVLCARTRSTTDVFVVEPRNPGAEASWDAGATLPAHLGAVAAGTPLVAQERATYPVGHWRAEQSPAGAEGFLSWFETGELPESGSAEPAVIALERLYAKDLRPLVHLCALDVGRRLLVFDVWAKRIDAMRGYRRVRQAMRRHRIPMRPGDTFPLALIALC